MSKKSEDAGAPEIVYMNVDVLTPHPKNPRKHPPHALKKIADSIREFGFTSPVILSKDGIILAGHARCKAAKMVGLTEVPCIIVPLTGQMADAYVIADNRLQLNSEWDTVRLEGIMKDLDAADFDLTKTFLEEQEIAKILGKKSEPERKPKDSDGIGAPSYKTVICPKCKREHDIDLKKAFAK